MNILYLTGHLEMGGTEIYTLNLARSIRSKGHNVVWASACTGYLKDEVEKSGIVLERCNLKKRTPQAFVSAVFQLKKIIHKYNIKVVHSADAYSALVASIACSNLKKSPKLVWSCVGIGMLSYALMHKLVSHKLSHIIAVSYFIRNRLIEAGFSPSNISVSYGTCDLKELPTNRVDIRNELGIGLNEIVIGSLGRLVKMKGNDTLIAALPSVLTKYPNARLVIVGDGPEKTKLMELCKNLDIQNKVIFTGMRRDIENMYATFDIVAFPTYLEAAGYIPLESMYYKKPIVASFTGGVPELVIDGYNGLLVPPAINQKWVEALSEIIGNKDLQNEFVNNGYKLYFDRFSSEHAIKQIESVYIACSESVLQ